MDTTVRVGHNLTVNYRVGTSSRLARRTKFYADIINNKARTDQAPNRVREEDHVRPARIEFKLKLRIPAKFGEERGTSSMH